jgi:hypothetical protein
MRTPVATLTRGEPTSFAARGHRSTLRLLTPIDRRPFDRRRCSASSFGEVSSSWLIGRGEAAAAKSAQRSSPSLSIEKATRGTRDARRPDAAEDVAAPQRR